MDVSRRASLATSMQCADVAMYAEIDLEDGPAHKSTSVQVHSDLAGMSSLHRRRKNTRMVGVCVANGGFSAVQSWMSMKKRQLSETSANMSLLTFLGSKTRGNGVW